MSRVDAVHITPAELPDGGTSISPTAFGKTWQATLSDVGAWSVSLQNDDPLLIGTAVTYEGAPLTFDGHPISFGDEGTPITYGDFVRFDLDGEPRFLGVVESIDTVSIAPNEEVDEVSTIAGRGSLAMWESAVVMPPNGVTGQPYTETRTFDWGAPELDISLWGTPALLAQAGQGSEGEPPVDFPERWLGYPLGWSDPTGYWIWSEAAGSGPAMPAGTSYFARDVNVTTAGYHGVYISADNRHTLRIDGVLISTFDDEGSKEGYQYTLRADVYLTAGVHRIAVEATNDTSAELAGFLFALWSQDANRDDDALVLRADDSWGAIGYPTDPPGFTAGTVIRLLLEEAQADGVLTGWSLSFDDELDSDGAAWPVDMTFAFRVGQDLLSVLRQMAASDIDFIADPEDLILHAYVIDTMGVAEGSATAELTRLDYLEFAGRS